MSKPFVRSVVLNRCSFPKCDCRGWCQHSNVAGELAALKSARDACTFPACRCVSEKPCAYMAYLCPVVTPAPGTPPPPKKKRPKRSMAERWSGVEPSALVAAVGEPCPYCGEAMTADTPAGTPMRHPTRDHVDPVALAGPCKPHNVVIACFSCNNDKDDLTLVQWYFELEEDGDPRARVVAALLKTHRPGGGNVDEADNVEQDDEHAEQAHG